MRYLISAFMALILSDVIAGSARAQAVASDPAATAGFKSAGINAVITGTSVNRRGLVIQLIIQNTRPGPIYISPITSADIGSAATSSTGNTYVVAQAGSAVSGMTPCNPRARTLNENVSKCLKEMKVEGMTFLESGQTTVLAINYDRRSREEESGDSVSFALKFIVRAAPSGTDGLTDSSQKAGVPGVVTISFPLVPLKTS